MNMRQWFGPAVAAAALALTPGSASAQAETYNFGCPSGYVLVGVDGWQDWWMDGVRGVCAQLQTNPFRVIASYRRTAATAGTRKGTRRTFMCPHPMVLAGFTGSGGQYLLSIRSLACRRLDERGRTESALTMVNAFPAGRPPIGGSANFVDDLCSNGQLVRGLRGRDGEYVNTLYMTCGYQPGSSAPVASAPTRPTISPISGTGSRTAAAPPAAPTLVSPANGIRLLGHPEAPGCYPDVDAFPEFRVNEIANAARYEVELRNVTQNKTMKAASTTPRISVTRYIPYRPVAGNSYSWRVRAINGIGVAGSWSGSRSFSAGAAPRADGPCVVMPQHTPRPW